MGKVLQFKTRAERQNEQIAAQPDPQSLYTLYREHTIDVCKDLMEFYKRTGQWDDACEQVMLRGVNSLIEVAALVTAKERTRVTNEPPSVG